jgi:hypothetical protein
MYVLNGISVVKMTTNALEVCVDKKCVKTNFNWPCIRNNARYQNDRQRKVEMASRARSDKMTGAGKQSTKNVKWTKLPKQKHKNSIFHGQHSSLSRHGAHSRVKYKHLLTYLLTYLITYLLTERSPSWEAANCAATQEFPSILWNPKVHRHVHKSFHRSLTWATSIQSIPSHLSKNYYNIVHLPTSWSS